MICEKCFNDGFLSEQIKSNATQSQLICSRCSAERVCVVSPEKLADFITPVLDLYAESIDANALPLIDYLKSDWQLFGQLDDIRCNEILDAIFTGQNLSSKTYESRQTETDSVGKWDEFQLELKHRNRFFPKTVIINRKRLEFLFGLSGLKVPPSIFYRARICDDGQAIPVDKMGKPPSGLTKGGRANPIGVSYLYTASDASTAIAEVRPHVGNIVTVASFNPIGNLRILDLRNPKKTVSPFSLNEDMLLDYFNELAFLCKLGEKLSKPILPKEADLEYLASQYLCEMIKDFGYDGVAYKSSLGLGFNVAFFDDAKLQINTTSNLHKVESVTYLSILMT